MMHLAKGAASSTLPTGVGIQPEGPGPIRICKVVICDDQPELRDAIRVTLAAMPRFTIVADTNDADSCLETVRDSQPDLLILDVNIPGGGPHVAAAAKTLQPHLHIVVFSGRADPAIEREMLAAGANQYVLKTGRVRPLLAAMDDAYRQITASAATQAVADSTRIEVASQDEHLLDGERCECGSPIMVRRRVVMGKNDARQTYAVWCTANAEHRMPTAVHRKLVELRSEPPP
ncbi:MAG: response regulator transcription factor [Nakamurella sp.]